jgi:ParB-like chromosome segregation protein Spo0J
MESIKDNYPHYVFKYDHDGDLDEINIVDIIPEFVQNAKYFRTCATMIENNYAIRPVVLRQVGFKYEILEGVHRINALHSLGYTRVLAWINA